jgi:hypothetical protein
MDAREPGHYIEAIPCPVWSDVTSPGVSGPAWEEFDTDCTTVFWIAVPTTESKRMRSYHLAPPTGPSETSALAVTLDATEDSTNGLTALEMAAAMKDEMAFVRAANEIDWSQRSAADFARSVRLALGTGAHELARRLAAQGSRLHPEHPELQKMGRVLAPPRVVRTGLPPVPSLSLNHDWLRTHRDEYRGQWVALKDGILLQTTATARQLWANLKSTPGVLITKVN